MTSQFHSSTKQCRLFGLSCSPDINARKSIKISQRSGKIVIERARLIVTWRIVSKEGKSRWKNHLENFESIRYVVYRSTIIFWSFSKIAILKLSSRNVSSSKPRADRTQRSRIMQVFHLYNSTDRWTFTVRKIKLARNLDEIRFEWCRNPISNFMQPDNNVLFHVIR